MLTKKQYIWNIWAKLYHNVHVFEMCKKSSSVFETWKLHALKHVGHPDI